MSETIATALRAREEHRETLQRERLYEARVRPFHDGVRDLLERARPLPRLIAALKAKHGAWFEQTLADLGGPLPQTESRSLRELHQEARSTATSIVQMFNRRGPELEATIAKIDNWTAEDTGDFVVPAWVAIYRSKLDQGPRNPEAAVDEARTALEVLLPQIREACASEPHRITVGGRGLMVNSSEREQQTHATRTIDALGEQRE